MGTNSCGDEAMTKCRSCGYLVDKCFIIVLDRKRKKTLFDWRRLFMLTTHNSRDCYSAISVKLLVLQTKYVTDSNYKNKNTCSNLTSDRISLTILLSLKTARDSLWNTSYSACRTATLDVKNKIFISVFDIVSGSRYVSLQHCTMMYM